MAGYCECVPSGHCVRDYKNRPIVNKQTDFVGTSRPGFHFMVQFKCGFKPQVAISIWCI